MSRVVTDSFFEFYLYSNLTYVVELYRESYRKVYTESLLHHPARIVGAVSYETIRIRAGALMEDFCTQN